VLHRCLQRHGISRLPNIAKTAKALVSVGYRTPAKIFTATDKKLTAIEGVGPATVNALKEAAEAAEDRGAKYVDKVIC